MENELEFYIKVRCTGPFFVFATLPAAQSLGGTPVIILQSV